jgi:hypothetical protein
METSRRNLLRGLAAGAGVLAPLGKAIANAHAGNPPKLAASKPTVRDRFWLFAHVAGVNINQYDLPGVSRMTPAEGAFYLGVPNIIMVAYQDPKEPCKMLPTRPYDPYLISFRPLKQVVWSMVGAGGVVSKADLTMICQLAAKYPNLVGVFMDDFFRYTLDGSRIGALTPKELEYVQSQLKASGRKLDLWVTYYRHDLHFDLTDWLQQIDILTFWTWEAKDLDSLEDDFAQAEKAAPKTRKLLGCYMWDFGGHKPMPMALMQRQCQLGLEWLRKGRIEGMIFLNNYICDLNLETVEWVRSWIQEVGDERI